MCEDPFRVVAWYDPRLPAPDAQTECSGRRLNGPRIGAAAAANERDYDAYHALYTKYLELRIAFLNKPKCVPLNGRIPAWDDALAQRLRDLGPNPTAAARLNLYEPMARHTAQVVADYTDRWNELTRTIDELAECNYVHNFGGKAHTRILDTDRGVDVTALPGVPLKAWTAPVAYNTDAGAGAQTGLVYDVARQVTHAQPVAQTPTAPIQQYESRYSSSSPPLNSGGTLMIFKDPATTQRYKALLWAAVKGH